MPLGMNSLLLNSLINFRRAELLRERFLHLLAFYRLSRFGVYERYKYLGKSTLTLNLNSQAYQLRNHNMPPQRTEKGRFLTAIPPPNALQGRHTNNHPWFPCGTKTCYPSTPAMQRVVPQYETILSRISADSICYSMNIKNCV